MKKLFSVMAVLSLIICIAALTACGDMNKGTATTTINSTTHTDIGEKMTDAADTLKDKMNEAKETMKDAAETVKDKVSDAAETVKDGIQDAGHAAESAAENASEKISEAMN